MEWKENNPGAQVLAPPKIKKVLADQTMDEFTDDKTSRIVDNGISCFPINGMPTLREYAFYHHNSKTLILTDLAFNFGKDAKGWPGFFLKVYGAYNKFGPTITIRALVKNKVAFKESLDRIASLEFDRIIVSHGGIIETNGNGMFRDAFRKYLSPINASLS